MGLVDVTSDNNFKRYIESESLLRGQDGKCFINSETIIKVYFNLKDKNKFTDLSNYFSPYISFPTNYYELYGKIIGEQMPYFHKEVLRKSINDKTNIKILKQNYLNIMQVLHDFREIYMKDLVDVNILYNEKGFAIIDTFDWKLRKNNLDVKNEVLFNEALISQICEVIELYYWSIGDSFSDKILKRGRDGQEMIRLLKWPNRESEYIFDILELFDYLYKKEYGINVETLDDVGNYIKILKNS